MQSKYMATCPQRTITEVQHTVATWLPVVLSCGHTERVNWTARVGEKIGCAECAKPFCRVCGEHHGNPCNDDFPEPGDLREWA